ncbi:Dullard-like phosphatase domain containing protein [Babesia bovis T2Bo]|uniref:Dullard-like phosphatase domain containing protein n=1 Tax=Babesia bovis TaxID=5865 RepID=A7AN33_BABBO|nr:Dullard-like phosphatase domain containing protein [Babesia bovis T2Bo]EDO07967.1 Dullard-like phosphatase domain containing protein [Babesia bovis T2Bo]|eukprot:XP_001611535.1 Dullard-like phosphatase domain containing protein [Babesia bovis T2Bo]
MDMDMDSALCSEMMASTFAREGCLESLKIASRLSLSSFCNVHPLRRWCKIVGKCKSQLCSHDIIELYEERKKLQKLPWPKAATYSLDTPRKKTLVLDLDETLIHSSTFRTGKHQTLVEIVGDTGISLVSVSLRPFAREFIAAATRMFEVVIFTAAGCKYANPIIDLLDCERRIHARLFREHCTTFNQHIIKDLSMFDRDSKDIVIIDNTPISYFLHPHNAIPISSWHDNRSDRELVLLMPFLRKLSTCDDVVTLIRERYHNKQEGSKSVSTLSDTHAN